MLPAYCSLPESVCFNLFVWFGARCCCRLFRVDVQLEPMELHEARHIARLFFRSQQRHRARAPLDATNLPGRTASWSIQQASLGCRGMFLC